METQKVKITYHESTMNNIYLFTVLHSNFGKVNSFNFIVIIFLKYLTKYRQINRFSGTCKEASKPFNLVVVKFPRNHLLAL